MTDQMQDIVATATSAGIFTTPLATAAGLAATLQGAGRFTVCAPNDAAFAKLAAILKLHVMAG